MSRSGRRCEDSCAKTLAFSLQPLMLRPPPVARRDAGGPAGQVCHAGLSCGVCHAGPSLSCGAGLRRRSEMVGALPGLAPGCAISAHAPSPSRRWPPVCVTPISVAATFAVLPRRLSRCFQEIVFRPFRPAANTDASARARTGECASAHKLTHLQYPKAPKTPFIGMEWVLQRCRLL